MRSARPRDVRPGEAASAAGAFHLNLDDYNLYSTEFNSSNPASVADMNGDGQLDIDDFTILASYFNTTLPVATRSR